MVVSAVDARVACGEPPFPVSGFCFPFSEMISKGQVWIVEVDKMRSDGVFPYVFSRLVRVGTRCGQLRYDLG